MWRSIIAIIANCSIYSCQLTFCIVVSVFVVVMRHELHDIVKNKSVNIGFILCG